MKKRLFVLIIVVVFNVLMATDQKVSLKEPVRPKRISVNQDFLYILQSNGRVLRYSLQDFQYQGKFIRKGEGPGEFKISPGGIITGDNYVSLLNEYQSVIFAKKGKVLRDIPNRRAGPLHYLGNNFVRFSINFNKKGKKKIDQHLYELLGNNLKKIKNLHSFFKPKQDYHLQVNPGGVKLKYTDGIKLKKGSRHFFDCENDRIYFGEIHKGIQITVYDQNGQLVNKFKKLYAGNEINSALKKRFINEFINQQQSVMLKKFDKNWRKKFENADYIFPNKLPAADNICFSDKKIYLKTFNKKDLKNEWIILDERGNEIKRVWLPDEGIYYFENQIFYNLIEEDEDWYLYKINL